MSDTMLLGVLRMPVNDRGDLRLMQLISRAREAADRIERDADRIAELEARIETLAAHVERLFETFNRISIEGENGMYSPRELEDAFCAIFSDGPDASLSRQKAQWQAEALEWLLDNWKTRWMTVDLPRHIANRAAELRRQSERTMEMNDNCPWRNRLDELIYQLAETIPNLNEPDYYKNELIDRLNELRRQAEENES